jgi:hypothetical protein
VNAKAKGGVRILLAVDHDLVSVGEDGGIAVCSRK